MLVVEVLVVVIEIVVLIVLVVTKIVVKGSLVEKLPIYQQDRRVE